MRGRFTGLDEIALSPAVDHPDGPARRRLELMRVQAAWKLAVGPRLRQVGTVLAYRDGVLSVDVRDKTWRKELERHEERVLARLGELLPGNPVRRITFRVSGGPPEDQTSGAPRAAPAAGRDPAPPVEDPDTARALRERFDQVMKRYLSMETRTRG